MTTDDPEQVSTGALILAFLLAALAVLSLPIGAWVFASRMEAAAFNQVTGGHVTTWQAMWIELRVQEQSVKEAPR
jgi:uncharacterized membrane protein YhfC